jgi:hypothetical protein
MSWREDFVFPTPTRAARGRTPTDVSKGEGPEGRAVDADRVKRGSSGILPYDGRRSVEIVGTHRAVSSGLHRVQHSSFLYREKLGLSLIAILN